MLVDPGEARSRRSRAWCGRSGPLPRAVQRLTGSATRTSRRRRASTSSPSRSRPRSRARVIVRTTRSSSSSFLAPLRRPGAARPALPRHAGSARDRASRRAGPAPRDLHARAARRRGAPPRALGRARYRARGGARGGRRAPRRATLRGGAQRARELRAGFALALAGRRRRDARARRRRRRRSSSPSRRATRRRSRSTRTRSPRRSPTRHAAPPLPGLPRARGADPDGAPLRAPARRRRDAAARGRNRGREVARLPRGRHPLRDGAGGRRESRAGRRLDPHQAAPGPAAREGHPGGGRDARAIPDLRALSIKGRANYVCARRVEQVLAEGREPSIFARGPLRLCGARGVRAHAAVG